jgi:hypothetical protein
MDCPFFTNDFNSQNRIDYSFHILSNKKPCGRYKTLDTKERENKDRRRHYNALKKNSSFITVNHFGRAEIAQSI